jgi:hypothetical protein
MEDRESEGERKAPSFYPPRSLALNPQKPQFEYLSKLIEDNPYKAFVVIHETLQSQMKYALYLDKKERFKGEDFGKRWSLLTKTRYFSELVKICFITGIVDNKMYDRLSTFNRDRNDLIGHIDPELTKDVPNEQVKGICERGLDLMKELSARIMDVLFNRVDKKE